MSPQDQKPYRDDPNLQDDPILLELAQAVKADPPHDQHYAAARQRLQKKLDAMPKENPFMNALKNNGRPALRWATATGLVLALAAGALFVNPFGRNPSQAYAAVAAALRKAVTVSFQAQWSLSEGQPPATIRIAFREPALERCEMEWKGTHTVQILDTAQNKSIILLPDAKSGIETELKGAPPADRERLELVGMLTQTVKNLPERADAVVGERVIDGRRLTGFHIGEDTYWIDVASKALVRVDKQMGGREFVMSDFRLDPADLGAEAFSIKLPAGYTAMANQPIKLDSSGHSEADLVKYLRLAAGMIRGHEFPASTNPMEILNLQKQGKLDTARLAVPNDDARQFMQDFSQAAQRSFMFIATLKPENDWHYAGKGTTLGDAKTPIAWWKPSGLKNYRVIWGDLRVTEEPPSVINGTK